MDRLEQGILHTGQHIADDDDDDEEEDDVEEEEDRAKDLHMQSLQKAWRQVRRTGERTVERQSGQDSALPMLYSSDWIFKIISVSLSLSLMLSLSSSLLFSTPLPLVFLLLLVGVVTSLSLLFVTLEDGDWNAMIK